VFPAADFVNANANVTDAIDLDVFVYLFLFFLYLFVTRKEFQIQLVLYGTKQRKLGKYEELILSSPFYFLTARKKFRLCSY